MHRQLALLTSLVLIGFGAMPTAHAGSSFDAADKRKTATWSVHGGVLDARFYPSVIGSLGLELTGVDQAAKSGTDYARFAIRELGSLEFAGHRGNFKGFAGGGLVADGGFELRGRGLKLDFRHFKLVVDGADPTRMWMVDGSGRAWFYIDHIMAELSADLAHVRIHSMDLRVGPALAEAVGDRQALDLAVAELNLTARASANTVDGVPEACTYPTPYWPGMMVAASGHPFENQIAQADVRLTDMSAIQQMECSACTGANPSGRVVLTPSATLDNPGSADVPWFTKFQPGNGLYSSPYAQNDQHPFLVWNIYRQNADGTLDHIGRSGVKHAFLTINSGALCNDCDSHVLGIRCADVYSTGNNHSSQSLGPRQELIPARGMWGRCGSIFDTNCDGNQNSATSDNFRDRLVVSETQLNGSQNPGAQYYFESWYIVRDDINIYNSMGYRQFTPSWSGTRWNLNGAGGYTLGPVLDRWVDPTNPPAGSLNRRGTTDKDGELKLAVRTRMTQSGLVFDYVIANYEFQRVTTTGAEPNLAISARSGITEFSIPLPTGVSVVSTGFEDGDGIPGNNWSVSTTAGVARWTAPAGNDLPWGASFRFQLTVTGAQVSTSTIPARLGTGIGNPLAMRVETLTPVNPSDTLFVAGF